MFIPKVPPPTILDKKLSTTIINYKFNKHINFISETTTAQLFNLRRLPPYMNTTTATLLTHSLIISRLRYCNSLLATVNKNKMKHFVRTINRYPYD